MRRALAVFFLIIVSASNVFAWGREGHRIVCRIAFQSLSKEDQQEVERLTKAYKTPPDNDLKIEGYPDACIFPDVARSKAVDARTKGETASPWIHFEPFNSWHKKDFDRHIVQTGGKRDARLPDTPTIYELFDEYKSSDVSRRVAQVMLTGGDLGRPMLVTPGTPAERLKILREAYLRSFKDTELLVETEKAKMDVDPTSGEELEALIKKVMDQPQEVTERVKKMLAN